MSLEERVAALEKKVSSLESILKKEKREERKKNSSPRELTEYQKYISGEIKKLKIEDPQSPHKELFKQAVSNWNQLQKK